MGTLFSSLHVSRSGLYAAQVQMDTTAHNISNVNTEGFSRQRATLITNPSIRLAVGEVGQGVTIGTTERVRDLFLDKLYRSHAPGLAESETLTEYFTRIEDIFLEPEEMAFGTQINDFFDALNDFANNVEQLPVRQAILGQASTMATAFNEVSNRLWELQTNANEEAIALVPEINSLSESIAALNKQIRETEVGGLRTANGLRDERDRAIDDLSELLNIKVFTKEDGQLDVLVGSDALVYGDRFNAIEAVRDASISPDRDDLVRIQYVRSERELGLRDGKLHGLLQARDDVLVRIDNRMDTLAGTLIEQINRIHSQSNGIEYLSGTIRSTNQTVDATTALDSADLPFAVQNGSFDVNVYDAAGALAHTETINVDPATMTLTDLVNALNSPALNAAGFSASVVEGNTIEITTAAGASYNFSNDSSDVLTAVGLNGFFTGHDAMTMRVNPDLIDNPLWIGSGYSLDIGDTGDSQAAWDMAEVRNGRYLDNGSSTLNDWYESIIVIVGIEGRAALDNREVETAFVQDFQQRRLEVSGVSVDEEVTNIMLYQRAYEAAARVIGVVDRLLETTVNLGRG